MLLDYLSLYHCLLDPLSVAVGDDQLKQLRIRRSQLVNHLCKNRVLSLLDIIDQAVLVELSHALKVIFVLRGA